jgi:hypothetical protein
MLATFISSNKLIMKVYSMVLIMYHKYYYFVKYIWLKFKVTDFFGNKNDSFFFGTEGVQGTNKLVEFVPSAAKFYYVF